MSLKAKLEAVIYAAEEPVTLTQLAALFAADALEWKAAQEVAAAEQTAEVAGVSPGEPDPLPLLAEGLEYLGLSETPSIEDAPGGEYATPAQQRSDADSVAPAESGAGPEAGSETRPEARPEAASETSPEAGEPATAEIVSISGGEEYPVIFVDDAAPAEESAAPQAASSGDTEAESKRQARQRDREVKAVLRQVLDELIAGFAADGRGVEIREIAGGYRMATKPECHDAVRLFVKSLKPPLKLSLPALETLAVIAYKQPVTAPEVNEIRGVESAGVLGSLLARKLIATAGRKPVIGRPILYKTTREFLLRFGLKDVSELPSMEEFEKMAATEFEMEPEAVEADRAASEAESGPESEVDENGETRLESNSPSGEELASAADNLTGADEAATTSAVDARQPDAADDTPAVPAASAAEPNPTEAVPAAPESTAQAETEAVSHAEKEEDR